MGKTYIADKETLDKCYAIYPQTESMALLSTWMF